MADPKLVTRRALKMIDSASEPFFLTVFYSNAHFPYAAPAPYYRTFSEPSYCGPYRYGKEFVLEGSAEEITRQDVKQVRALYDGCVAAVDNAIRELIEGLQRRNLDSNTILVITSDHGEALYENGRGQGHGDHLLGDECNHIPLLIRCPTETPGRLITNVVRDVDLAPTLCELAGIPLHPEFDGRSLVPLIRGEPQPPVLAYAESEIWFNDPMPSMPSDFRVGYPNIELLTEIDREHDDEIVIRKVFEQLVIEAKHRMVHDGRFKLVYVPTRTAVRWMLFDTLNDPAELTDVSAAYPAVAESLKAALWKWMLGDIRMKRCGDRLVQNTHAEAHSGSILVDE